MATTATPFLDALTTVSEIAHAKLPATLHGRLERATAIVLHGGVFFDDAGVCQVRASDDTTWYTVNGHCPCGDLQAPEHLCKHRLARGLYLRTTERLREPGEVPGSGFLVPGCEPETRDQRPETTTRKGEPMPEALYSITLKGTMRGRDALLTARGQTWQEFQEHLAQIEGLLDAAPPASPPPTPEETRTCPTHGTAMKLQVNAKGAWWSHKHGEGWCKGK